VCPPRCCCLDRPDQHNLQPSLIILSETHVMLRTFIA
jgi:hypothetical protein